MSDKEDHDLLVIINANFDNLIKRFDKYEEGVDKKFTEIFKRIRFNERVVWSILGIAGFLNASLIYFK